MTDATVEDETIIYPLLAALVVHIALQLQAVTPKRLAPSAADAMLAILHALRRDGTVARTEEAGRVLWEPTDTAVIEMGLKDLAWMDLYVAAGCQEGLPLTEMPTWKDQNAALIDQVHASLNMMPLEELWRQFASFLVAAAGKYIKLVASCDGNICSARVTLKGQRKGLGKAGSSYKIGFDDDYRRHCGP